MFLQRTFPESQCIVLDVIHRSRKICRVQIYLSDPCNEKKIDESREALLASIRSCNHKISMKMSSLSCKGVLWVNWAQLLCHGGREDETQALYIKAFEQIYIELSHKVLYVKNSIWKTHRGP